MRIDLEGGTSKGEEVGNHYRLGIPEGPGCISPREKLLREDMKAKFNEYMLQ